VIDLYDTSLNKLIPNQVVLNNANTATITWSLPRSGWAVATLGGTRVLGTGSGGGGGGTTDVSAYLSSSWTGSGASVFSGTASYVLSASVATSASRALNANFATVASTASYAFTAQTASFVTTASFANTALTASYVAGVKNADTASFVATASWARNAVTASYVNAAETASYVTTAQTASYVQLTAGPGIVVDNLTISSSIVTVNGVAPTNGNVVVSLTEVYTGTSASFAASSSGTITSSFSEGSIWVISGDPTPAENGLTYVYNSSSVGEWLQILGFDYATADARYLKLDTSNDPLTGNLNLGGNRITNLADAVASGDAVSLGYLTASYVTTNSIASYTSTASFNNWTGSNASVFAGTASYVNLVAGPNITINQNGTAFEISGSGGGGSTPNLQDVITVGGTASGSFGISTEKPDNGTQVTASTTEGAFWVTHKDVFTDYQNSFSIGTLGEGNGFSYYQQTPIDSAPTETTEVLFTQNASKIRNTNLSTEEAILEFQRDFNLDTLTQEDTYTAYLRANKVVIKTAEITGSLLGTATTASYVNLVAGPNVTINQVGEAFEISASGGGGGTTDVSTYLSSSWTGSAASVFAGTASYVSGAISNIPDPYTTTSPVNNIVTLTSAEYTALGTKVATTLYIVI
jgi:hypothetical protein